MKKLTLAAMAAAALALTGMAKAQTTLYGDHEITGSLTVDGSITTFSGLALPNASLGGDSFTIGEGSTVSGSYSFALGYYAEANDYGAMALGSYTQATGSYALAMGSSSEASGGYSVAIGNVAIASGSFAVAVGTSTSTGYYSVALGASYSSGDMSTALGGAGAYGNYSLAAGSYDTYANADYSLAVGQGVTASVAGQMALGQFNDLRTSDSGTDHTQGVFVLGYGSDDTHRANAIRVLSDGTTLVKASGDIGMGGFTSGPKP